MSVMKMVDGSGRSMKMVDGVMSMGMMSVVKMVISCHSFLYVRYYLLFGFLGFYSFCLTVMVVICFFFRCVCFSFCSVLVELH